MMAEHAPLPPAAYVRTSAHMREAMARLRAELAHDPLLAVDTEANSMYAYRERVCLIQLSTRQSPPGETVHPCNSKDFLWAPQAPKYLDTGP